MLNISVDKSKLSVDKSKYMLLKSTFCKRIHSAELFITYAAHCNCLKYFRTKVQVLLYYLLNARETLGYHK